MFPGPTELRLIGYSIESIWTQTIQVKYIDTKNQLADILTKGNFTRDEWNHMLCLFNVSHFSPTVCSEALAKILQQASGKEHESQQNRSRWWIWSRDAAWGILMCYLLLHQKGRGKPDMKVKYLWARGLSSIIERGDLWWTLDHQTTQNGMLTKNGLLKSGNLMKCWKQERRDL